MTATVTRFAPSPTGLLHLGHAYSALYAARAGDRFVLRIEDIDRGRYRRAFEDAIFEDLAWLGLHWEEPVRRQSAHFDDYAKALARLDELGVLYRCVCTRRQIATEIAAAGAAPQGPDGPVYPGTCRRLGPAEIGERPFAWRLDVAKALAQVDPAVLTWIDRQRGKQVADPVRHGDVVLARKDTPTSYHLSVTVDDAIQQITLVTRGEDLRPTTDIHRLLQALLGLPTPDYDHHRLLLDADGARLAKRDGARSLREYRDDGLTPEDVRRLVGLP
ncbi:MAG: tRNA glutamyl-Q(34) synthetase GluQRS [Alphaproteobacteria bacterium]